MELLNETFNHGNQPMNHSHHPSGDEKQTSLTDGQSTDPTLLADLEKEDGNEEGELSESIIALLGEDYQKLFVLRDYLETEKSRVQLVAKSLPGAIALATKEERDKKELMSALLPFVRWFQTHLEKSRRRRLHFFWFMVCLLTGVAVWFWQQQVQEVHIRQNRAWQTVQQSFRNEPGYHITEAWRETDGYRLYGLRDPYARPPESIATMEQRTTLSLQWRWTPMAMEHADFIVARAKVQLDPPDNVTMTWNQGILNLVGKASLGWIRLVEQRALSLPWVDRVDRIHLIHEETHEEAWQRVSRRLGGQKLFVQQGHELSLSGEGSAVLKQIAQEIGELVTLASAMGRRVRILVRCQVVVGMQDETEAISKGLDYGEKVLMSLVQVGVDFDLFDLESQIIAPLSDPKIGAKITFSARKATRTK